MLEELGDLNISSLKGKGKAKDADGDTDMGADEVEDKKEGRIYLFQFPPRLPNLYNPEKEKPNTATAEADGTVEGDDTAAASGSTAPIDLTKDSDGGEEEVVVKTEPETKEERKRRKRADMIPEEGYLGKMIVRESGKVELSWGGVSLEVKRGIQSSFLSNVVIVDSKPGEPEGVATSMGKVMGKFVVRPDLDKFFGRNR